MPSLAGTPDPTATVIGEWTSLGDGRYELGEGARWIEGSVYFVDLLAGRLLRTDPDRDPNPEPLLTLDMPLGAVAPFADGWLAAAGTGLVRIGADGHVDILDQPAAHSPTPLRVNDAVADPHGRFWFGTMALNSTPDAGSVYRRDTDGTLHSVVTGITIPNGPVFNAEGTTMYLADTARSVIYTYPVDPSGALGDRSVFARVEGQPDGMTIDADGYLWAAIWGGSRLHRYTPDGALAETIPVPASQPTSVALSPTPPYRIIVTTATHSIQKPDRHDGRIITASTTIRGLPTASAR
jgi:sugar lactone lactonase YvrE